MTAFIFLSESVGINTTPLIYTRSHWCLAVIWYLHCSAESIKTLHMYLSTSGPQRTELGGFNDVSLTSDVRERQIEEGSSGGFPRGMFFLVWFVFQAQQKNSPDLDHRRADAESTSLLLDPKPSQALPVLSRLNSGGSLSSEKWLQTSKSFLYWDTIWLYCAFTAVKLSNHSFTDYLISAPYQQHAWRYCFLSNKS